MDCDDRSLKIGGPFSRKAGSLWLLAFVFFGGSLFANGGGDDTSAFSAWLRKRSMERQFPRHERHHELVTELEIYPFNIVVPTDPVIKNEVMIDYHGYSPSERALAGVRFFTEANTHYRGERDMKDLLLYTQGYVGLEMFQLGIELGSVTGHEYFSAGPQLTIYDTRLFKRISLVTRVYPDWVLGYEFTSKELPLFSHLRASATGMCRVILPCDERIFQVSAWLSWEKFERVFIGVEYEYNNAEYFNNNHYEKNNEFFLGIKFELE